ncbi:hypothetical protein QA612_02575 [Evansella sp. AB-P1]|uniref:hypothetical protein n=1 Tax=Evansella sp. AB-P1 TaxID=3037653 RepID=UPI00241C8406|nr:hypothetical protein [Evansella sp. AB-P1]MDG5786360.1 hypothetical protein [Evansella sp. AB-P1]
MNYKFWGIYLLILNISGFATLLYINYSVYGNIIESGFFVVMFIPQLIMIHKIIVKENKRAIMGNSGAFLVLMFAFMIAMPSVTYEEGKEIVEEYYEIETIEFLETDWKYTYYNDSRFLLNGNYYYTIKLNGVDKYLMVDPIDGKVIEFN